MRVCLVSKEVEGVRGGGIGTYVVEAGHALSAAGHQVCLMTPRLGEDELLGLRDAFDEIVQLETGKGRPLFHARHWFAHCESVREALRALPPFDYVEFPDYHAEGLVALRAHRQLGEFADSVFAVQLHTPSFECFELNGQLHRAGEDQLEIFALEDETIREAPRLLSPSRALAERVCGRLGLAVESVDIVPYPMRTIAPAPLPRADSARDLRYVAYGRMEPRKGFDMLLEAFRSMPELRLEILGADTDSSPYGDSYAEWLRERAPKNVVILPGLRRDQLWTRLREEHVCLFPSRFDNYPNACLEAMALGRVVVGSEHGGMAEMIRHGRDGFLCDPNSPEHIVDVLTRQLPAAFEGLSEIGARAATRAADLACPTRYVERIEEIVRKSAHRDRSVPSAPVRRGEGTPELSIVLPFYVDGDTIGAAVGSALDQQGADIEVLLVDDGSPLHEAADLLETQRRRDPRVRLLQKTHGGLSSARNHGIAHARGEYVLMLDADNMLRPDYARCAIDVLSRRPEIDWVVPNVCFLDAETGTEKGIYNPLPYSRSLALMMNRFGDAGACFRRTVFREHGVRYDEQLVSFEDWALWIDLDRLGLRGCCIPVELYDYRVRDDSMVRRIGWQNLSASLGLLIQDHFPVADDEQRRQLWALQQTWGDRAYGRDLEKLDRAHRDHAGTIRHRDALARRVENLERRVEKLLDRAERSERDHAGTMRHRDHLLNRVQEFEGRLAELAKQLEQAAFPRWRAGPFAVLESRRR